jgi:DNA-binding IclR family transcriptional regulator
MMAGGTTVSDWLELIRAEYLEIPGLHLTRTQFQRLWNLDDVTCDSLLQTLIDRGFLRQTDAGGYVRA